jgi:hypothetical protein
MRYRVEFRYREDTGEVEMLQVEVVEGPPGRAADHDAQHDRMAAEIASVLEPDAEIDEVDGIDAVQAAPAAEVRGPQWGQDYESRPGELPPQVS